MSKNNSEHDKDKNFNCDAIKDILRSLKPYYNKHAKPGEWEHEKSIVSDLLPLLIKDIQFNYAIDETLGLGGSGIVFKVKDINLSKSFGSDESSKPVFRALKFARPVAGKEPILAKVLGDEVRRLRDLSHPNVVDLYAVGEVRALDRKWPWYVMEYVHNAKDLDYKCNEGSVGIPDLIRILNDASKGLKYVHDSGFIHCDIKPENIFVSPDYTAIVADFGFAKDLGDSNNFTTLGFTQQFAHPKLLELGKKAVSDPKRWLASITQKDLNAKFDIYALGKSIIFLLNKYFIARDVLKRYAYEVKFLHLMATRMLDGKNRSSDNECAAGLPEKAYLDPSIRYHSMNEVCLDFSKLMGEYSLIGKIPELNPFEKKSIQVSRHSPVILTTRMKELIDSPYIVRLGHISQLGIIKLVYPGAVHSRKEHVLGTLGKVARYILSLYHDKLNPLFCQIVKEEDIRACLLAAVFHDIAHYPLAHDLEEIESDYFSHERLGLQLLKSNPVFIGNKKLHEYIKDTWAVEFETILEIISSTIRDDIRQTTGNLKARMLKTLIDGPIDADKLDYLLRDASHLGLPYAQGIDLEMVLRCLTITCRETKLEDVFLSLGVHEKGKVCAEGVEFARYCMFSQVYWHHTVREAKAKIARVMRKLIINADSFNTLMDDFEKTFVGNLGEQQIPLYAGPKEMPSLTNLSTRKFGECRLDAGEIEVLSWIANRTDDESRALIDSLINRNIYKRALVISYSEDKDIWNNCLYFFSNMQGKYILLFEEQLAEEISKKLRSLSKKKSNSITLSNEDLEKRLDVKNILPLVLVDMPMKRPSSSYKLLVMPEWGTKKQEKEKIEPISCEEAPVWSALFLNIQHSASKMRVFVRPDIYEAIDENISRADLKNFVVTIMERLKKEAQKTVKTSDPKGISYRSSE